MEFFNTWGGVAAMFALAAAIFAYNFWARAVRRRAIDRGEGLGVASLGRGLIVAGLLIGGAAPLFGEVPPDVLWRDIAAVSFMGVAAAVLLVRRTRARWESALRQSNGLPSHVLKRWESGWVTGSVVVALVLFSIFYPGAVDAFSDLLGSLGKTISYGIAAFFVVYGILISLWARREARKYGGPITLPMVRR